MSDITRKTIGFRDIDLANITKIMEHVDVENEAHAVAQALSLAELILREMAWGADVKLHHGNITQRITVGNLKRKVAT